MAVEVLDYQGFSKLRTKLEDVDEAVMVHMQSMQNLVTLLVKQQNCTLSNATISDFKKLITLHGGSGHARFRRAPATPLSEIPSQGQHVTNKVRSSSAPRDAVQTNQVSEMEVQPNSSCSPFKHADVCLHDTSVHDGSTITVNTQEGRVFHPFTSCSPSENKDKVHVHDCNVSMKDDSQMLCVASTGRLDSHIPPHNHACSRCKEGNRDTNHSRLRVSGHARCRDSTAQKFCHQDSAVSTCAFSQVHKTIPCLSQHAFQSCADLDQAAFVPKTNGTFLSSLSTDGGAGTVSSGKPVISSGRPPLPPKKRKSPEKIEDHTRKCHNSVNCHCAKRRKLKTTRRILRVPAMGLNNGDIPADGYSWCIYGEKLSKESSQPRVYYKCSSVRGCPARKHVERASDDPNMLIVTYGREHLHPQIHKVLMGSE